MHLQFSPSNNPLKSNQPIANTGYWASEALKKIIKFSDSSWFCPFPLKLLCLTNFMKNLVLVFWDSQSFTDRKFWPYICTYRSSPHVNISSTCATHFFVLDLLHFHFQTIPTLASYPILFNFGIVSFFQWLMLRFLFLFCPLLMLILKID